MPAPARPPLRVVVYAHRYVPSGGGVETATTHLAENLMALGHDVTVVTTTPPGAPGYPRCRMAHTPTWRQVAHLFSQADVVHLQGFATLPTTIALLSGRPIVWDHHDFDLICPKSIAWWGGWCTYGAAKCAADLRRDHPLTSVVGLQLTLAVRKLFARHRRWTHIVHSRFVHEKNGPTPSVVLPYGIPQAMLRVTSSVSSRRIVATGRLIAEKGFDTLLDAMADPRLAKFEVEIVGSGPAGAALQERAAALQVADRVRFPGRLHGPALDAVFQNTLAIVVPSVWDEPFGIVALEGMARGIPVIATSAGGLGEIAAKGGVLVPRSDPGALADALHELATDPVHHARIASKGAALARAWTWERLAEDYVAAYEQAISLTASPLRSRASSPRSDAE